MATRKSRVMPVFHTDIDRRVLWVVMALMGVGVSLVASSSSFFSGGVFSDHFYLLNRHLVKVFIALVIMMVAVRIDYMHYRRLAPVGLVVGIALMIGLSFYGANIRNTERWFYISSLNMAVQPADIARMALVFFLAYWITRSGRDFTRFKEGFLPAAAASMLVIALIALTPNYGNATATLMVSVLIMFLGGARIAHLAGMVGAVVLVGFVKVLSAGYVRERIAAYLNPDSAVDAINWQVHQSLIGLGSGGLFGVGLGDSAQKFSWLPDAYTDFIFAILGEELGLIGTVAVSLLFLLLALRALKISRQCGDTFGEMLAAGIGCSVFVYAMLNMAVTTGLFPVTGLPLPFISYGGSAMTINAFAVGVLLNISRTRRGKGARNLAMAGEAG